jgi:hypothetical protein
MISIWPDARHLAAGQETGPDADSELTADVCGAGRESRPDKGAPGDRFQQYPAAAAEAGLADATLASPALRHTRPTRTLIQTRWVGPATCRAVDLLMRFPARLGPETPDRRENSAVPVAAPRSCSGVALGLFGSGC